MRVLEVDEDIRVVTRYHSINLGMEYGTISEQVIIDCIEEHVFSYNSTIHEVLDTVYGTVIDHMNDIDGMLKPEIQDYLISSRVAEIDYISNITESIEYELQRIENEGKLVDLNNYVRSVNVVDVSGKMFGETLLLSITNTE